MKLVSMKPDKKKKKSFNSLDFFYITLCLYGLKLTDPPVSVWWISISCQSAFKSAGEDLDLIFVLTILCAEKGCAKLACEEVCKLLI